MGLLRLKSPFRDRASAVVAWRFGMALFLSALGVLFAATLIGMIIVRWQLTVKGEWPSDLPRPPFGLWGSTGLLVVSAFTAQWARSAADRDDARAVLRLIVATLAIGVAFLVIQAFCWVTWSHTAAVDWHGREGYRIARTGFYVLTGLHAAHVVGGLIALAWAIRQARRDSLGGIRFHVAYWHFLGAAWAVIYAFLLAT